MIERDERFTPDGVTATVWDSDAGEVWREVDGVEVDGSRRDIAAAEMALRFPPPPLVPQEKRLDEDTMAASIALLTEDSVGYRALLHVITQALQIPEAVIEQAQAAATERLVALAENPEVRRQMMAERIARAEAARGE